MNRSNTAKLALLPLFAALAVGSASPKKDDTSSTSTTSATAKVAGACDLVNAAGWCTEYYKDDFFLEMAKNGCEHDLGGHAGTGRWSAGACSKDHLVGKCTEKDETQLFYFPMQTSKSARSICERKPTPGTFEAIGTVDEAAVRASCFTEAFCDEWTGASGEPWEEMRSQCRFVDPKATFVPSKGCAAARALARCDRPDGTRQFTYAKGELTFKRSLCANQPGAPAGTWTVLPSSAPPSAGARGPVPTTKAKTGR